MLKMLKHYYLKRSKTFQYASAGLTILLVAALGTLILNISRAASPNAAFSATSGTLAGGSSLNQSCAGASGNNCVVFGRQLAMDGNVALALMNPGTPFAPTSFWNTPLPDTTPVNTNTPSYLNAIQNNICFNVPNPPATSFIATTTPASCTRTNYYGALNSTAYSAPLYVAPANYPTVNVGITPGCNTTNSGFLAALANVPVPPDAHGSGSANVPNPPTITNAGTSGATNYSYSVASITASGTTEPSSSSSTNTGNAVLSTTNYNVITWTPVAGALQYKIYRVGSGGTPSSGGLIATVSSSGGGSQTFNDTGIAATTAVPVGDTDEEIQIYQPSADNGNGKYWDFWRFHKDSGGNWETCWGGTIDNVSQSNGVFTNSTGAMATSLPLLGAIPRIEELQAGQINHAIGLTVGDVTSADLAKNISPTNCLASSPDLSLNVNGAGISSPATRTDGASTDPCAIPEGLRFRLPASFNLTQYNNNLVANHQNPLTPVAATIATAVQKYGFVIDDSCPQPCMIVRVGDPTTYTVAGLPDPYTNGPGVGGAGSSGLYAGVPSNQIMQNFPWGQLEALPFNY